MLATPSLPACQTALPACVQTNHFLNRVPVFVGTAGTGHNSTEQLRSLCALSPDAFPSHTLPPRMNLKDIKYQRPSGCLYYDDQGSF